MLSCRNKERQKNIQKIEDITLIDTFFIDSMFINDKYEDRYYTGMLKYLDDKTSKKIYFVPRILFKNNFKKKIDIANKASEQFLYSFDFLKISDYFFQFLISIKIIISLKSLKVLILIL